MSFNRLCSKKNRIAIIIITVLCLGLITGWYCVFYAGAESSMKKNMEEYLHTRYGRDFVLKKPQLIGGSWVFKATTYIARGVYPADDPDLKFDITWDTVERTYIDSYLAAKWSKEGRQAMEEKLREVYGDGNFFIRKYFSGYNDVADQKFTWAELMKNRSQYNRIDFNYFVFFDGELDRKREAERAYKILKETLIDYRVRQYNFSVDFIYGDKKKECLDIWADRERSRHETSDTMHKARILKDWIRVNYAKIHLEKGSKDILDQEVKSAEQLLKTRFQIKEEK